MAFTGQTLNILLAEDNADDVFFFENAFQKAEGSGVLSTVSDGVEVLAYLNAEGPYRDRANFPFPDVLLLDLNMPRMNGFEVLEWIRQNPKCSRLMVHILTSSCRDADTERAYDLHANSFVVKPGRVDQLTAFIRALHQWHRFLALSSGSDCAKVEAQSSLVR